MAVVRVFHTIEEGIPIEGLEGYLIHIEQDEYTKQFRISISQPTRNQKDLGYRLYINATVEVQKGQA